MAGFSYPLEKFDRIKANPNLKIITSNKNKIVTNELEIILVNPQGYELLKYNYSPFYDCIISGKFLLITSNKYLEIRLIF